MPVAKFDLAEVLHHGRMLRALASEIADGEWEVPKEVQALVDEAVETSAMLMSREPKERCAPALKLAVQEAKLDAEQMIRMLEGEFQKSGGV